MVRDIILALKRYQRFVVTGHARMDGDAFGSVLGLTHILRDMGKTVIPITQGDYPDVFKSFSYPPFFDITNDDWCYSWYPEVIICLDSSSIDRVQAVLDYDAFRPQLIINIDHHLSNTLYAPDDYNWVVTDASSTCEMITFLARDSFLPINQDAASFLYLGIVTDTNNFMYSNVKADTLKAASYLTELGAKPSYINEQLYVPKSFNWYKLEARVLDRLTRLSDRKVAWTYVSYTDFESLQLDMSNAGILTALIAKLADAQVCCTFFELSESTVKVSLRTRSNLDLSQIVSGFGGGGHPKAAGFQLEGRLADVINTTINTISNKIP